ncbi:carboxypeptidase-like regulatory domain-containing protein [Hymenobacter sp. GOD-10R]|uniref:carboxypeptidase-like regulatory domain-containing protein n=1 Tax=Hymenobacter sp. GOD-10R TaxID=3093922 RepID=UPI002D79D38A|nr:carboxypeptidase-like regulatory domain-containing protein [Hymenobacter sp. GOD-10R]WRQ28432.1 carboxypeptidase-like regulatory domain-containing protein [Hymenobacter sp. GOD-10R]
MPHPSFSIPSPCSHPWDAMTPTGIGRHCAVCATEVVDFSRMSETEILAFLAQPRSKPVCGNAHAAQLQPPTASSSLISRWSRWVAAGLALFGLHPTTTQAAVPPVPLASLEIADAPRYLANHAAVPKAVVLQGRVLDDSTGLGVPGAWIFIDGTKYGAVTDDEGRFSITLPASWKSLQKGKVSLRVQASPFEFKPRTVVVTVPARRQPAALAVRLLSVPGRGQIMGRIKQADPPVAPPKS